MSSVLIITNDFPPRQGGIETFVHAMATRMPSDDVIIYTSCEEGDTVFDVTLPFPVVRDTSRMLLPTGRVTQRAVEIAKVHGCDRVWFGAAAPLALMAPALRRGGIRRIVATTHGHETWWAALPGPRQVLRRIGERVDMVTYLTGYTRARIVRALGPRARTTRLVPGVDTTAFRPDADGLAIRDRYGLGDRPVILSVSRLVPRKGQDQLIRALPLVRCAVPGATLLIVGAGPYEARLRRLAGDGVVFAGGHPHQEMPPFYAAADIFAMPCRTRRMGLEAEGLGIVFLEAAAAGLPVLAGDSGGVPEAVRDGETGHVVNGRSVPAIADRLTELLTAPGEMGEKGRAWVQAEWSWERSYERLSELLSPTVGP